jgi:hypothetical protein
MKPEEVPKHLYKDVFTVPKNFNEAWNHPCPFQRKLWREGFMLEFKKMKEHKVWHVTKRSNIPKGKRCIKCRWVLDIKKMEYSDADW